MCSCRWEGGCHQLLTTVSRFSAHIHFECDDTFPIQFEATLFPFSLRRRFTLQFEATPLPFSLRRHLYPFSLRRHLYPFSLRRSFTHSVWGDALPIQFEATPVPILFEMMFYQPGSAHVNTHLLLVVVIDYYWWASEASVTLSGVTQLKIVMSFFSIYNYVRMYICHFVLWPSRFRVC